MIDVPSAVAAGGGDNHLSFGPGESSRMEDSFSSDEQEALFEAVGCERNEEWKVATQVRNFFWRWNASWHFCNKNRLCSTTCGSKNMTGKRYKDPTPKRNLVKE